MDRTEKHASHPLSCKTPRSSNSGAGGKIMSSLRTLFSVSLVSLSALTGCDQPDVDTRDIDEPASAAQPAVVDAAVRVEQAERALDVGRDLAAARASLEAVLADKDAPADVRDRAAMTLSRACEALKDSECAVRSIEDLLTGHGTDPRWHGAEAAERRLRKLLTGSEELGSLQVRSHGKTSAFARVLAGYFEKKGDVGRKEPIDISVLLFGNDARTSQQFGTFNVEGALRDKAQEQCPACDDGIKTRGWISQTSSWTSIPAMKGRFDASVVAFYTHLGDPIPARYDSLLPIPMSEVIAHLQKGEGLFVAKERPGAPPVILVAAPREMQLAEIEDALSQAEKLPASKVIVKPSPSLAPDEIKGVMRRSATPGLKACYEELLGRSPGASGRLVLSFAVQAQGEVTDLEVTGEGRLDDAKLKECAASTMKPVRFPASGTRTTVKYPFLFEP
jgi:hypothetical protein